MAVYYQLNLLQEAAMLKTAITLVRIFGVAGIILLTAIPLKADGVISMEGTGSISLGKTFIKTASNHQLTANLGLSGADVAVYNDAIAPVGYQGAWSDGIIAIKSMLALLGLTYEEITYNDLNYSTQNFSDLYKVMLFPGGTTRWYDLWISLHGKERIRSFVNNGGGYLGICAGAYFAVDKTWWDGVFYDDNEDYNAYGELTGCDLDLFPGTGTGPITGIADYFDEGYAMESVSFNSSIPMISSYKTAPYSESILYYGGPYFTIDPGAEADVLATYDYNGLPAIVACRYGQGKVVLFGPHPEIEEDSDRDGVKIDREDQMNDNGSDWNLMLYVLNWLMDRTVAHAIFGPDTLTVAPGETLGPIGMTRTNTGTDYESFYSQGYVVAPGGKTAWRSQILLGLSPGETRSGLFYTPIPLWSGEGSFIWGEVLFDIYGNTIEDRSFNFTIKRPASAF